MGGACSVVWSSGFVCDSSIKSSVEQESVKQLGAAPPNSSQPRHNMATPMHQDTICKLVVHVY